MSKILKTRQQGTVLIVVLFIVALIEIVLVSLVTQHRLAIRHTRNYLFSMEAQNIALSGEDWACAQILTSFNNHKIQNQFTLNKTPIANGYIEGSIEDMQGRFNLNNIQDLKVLQNFNHMLKTLFPSINPEIIDKYTGTLFSQQIQNFISKNNSSHSIPSPDNYPFVSITELRNAPFITYKNFETLLPYFTVLPDNKTPLNVNSATNYSLLSLSDSLDLKTTDAIIKIRDHMKGFSSTSSFFAIEPLKNSDTANDNIQITIVSQYYLSSIHVNYHNVDLTLYSLISVFEDQNHINTAIIWRSFGTL